MAESRKIVFNAVLESADVKPVPERIKLLKATAEIIGEPELTRELLAIASDLERAEQRCQEFRFRFNLRGGRK
jgi:hypothetical protein